jgi:AcrR family transcriptional regulator
MAVKEGPSAREAKRLQTRERLMGAAVAEFTRSGMADADVGAIVTAAGVAHGTFFFHFPTKEHVLLELERREENRMAKQFGQYLGSNHDLASALNEAVRLVLGLERRLGEVLFREFLALHFSQTRPPAEDGRDHALVVLLAQRIEHARERGDLDPEVIALNSAVFFLLGLYALAITTNEPLRGELITDHVKRTLRSMAVPGQI